MDQKLKYLSQKVCQNTEKILNFSFLFLIVLSLTSCFTVKYSTSGASISPDVKSVSVLYFPNRAAIVQPTLSQEFTDKLREKIRQNTSLSMVTDGGDTNFEGEITGFNVQPKTIQAGNDDAATNRLTITVHVKFTNTIDPKFSYDANFSRYQDYSTEKNLDQVTGELVPKIIEELTEDIFNKAFVNW